MADTGTVSFNLYMLAAGPALRPCEMPAEDVIAFVLGYVPGTEVRDATPRAIRTRGRMA